MTISEIEEWTRSEIWLEALGSLDLDIEVRNLIADWKLMKATLETIYYMRRATLSPNLIDDISLTLDKLRLKS